MKFTRIKSVMLHFATKGTIMVFDQDGTAINELQYDGADPGVFAFRLERLRTYWTDEETEWTDLKGAPVRGPWSDDELRQMLDDAGFGPAQD